MPVSPSRPEVVLTIRTLEVFRRISLRCPRLGIQAFVRALCDIHHVPPRPYLSVQFTVAFDLYLALRRAADKRVQVALGRDAPNWRLKNACPSCTYKLEGEPELLIPTLVTIDGNNSLSRFWRRAREEVGEDGSTIPGESRERQDDRPPPGDRYLPREEVDEWSRENLAELMKTFPPPEEEDEDEDESGCSERWQNMKEDVTARAYGMYDETGIFPALCRHGFCLIIVDMIKSGELAQYGYAVAAHLMRTLGPMGLGYDIGCKFAKMVRAHPTLASLARDTDFRALVGAFHGAGHNRKCQTRNLTMYVPGVGTEPLEGCEIFFSKSNNLASTTRYATRFHRQQAIVSYLDHADTCDAYQGLCMCPLTLKDDSNTSLALLLASKYRNALKIKKTLPALQQTMDKMGVPNRDVFETWLEAERRFLDALSKEPLEETLQMEYLQKLIILEEHEERMRVVLANVPPEIPASCQTTYDTAVKETRRIETQRRHALELHSKSLAVVQDLEYRLRITPRWVRGSPEWEATEKMVQNRRYQRALDHLEGLVVARMFELTKVNMSGTGYKLRKHIAKALQSRSKAVKAAIERYNSAAMAMSPPRTTLTWEEVVEYAFLADFDLLRDGREDIRDEPWAQPSGRAAMDQHFKLLRADEEIIRLNVEIPRLVTHMVDEEAFLVYHETRLADEGNAALAHQVRLQRVERGRFNALHMERLVKLGKTPGFTASLVPGVSVSKERRVPDDNLNGEDAHMAPPAASPLPAMRPVATPPANEPKEDDGDDGEQEIVAARAYEHIVRIAHDPEGPRPDPPS
ncbi:hypothetical protein C8R43DRAFT_1090251 [Mycena crocata]|nr:hypothetical protein C8R43DRAFT_1090251 [Mycena crocata]